MRTHLPHLALIAACMAGIPVSALAQPSQVGSTSELMDKTQDLSLDPSLAQQTPNAPQLPPPTEEQLKNGRALLAKLMHIVKKVPLSKPSAVFRVFEVDEIEARALKDRNGQGDVVLVQLTSYDPSVRTRWREMGVRILSVDYPLDRASASEGLSLSFLPAQACVSIDDVRELFVPITKTVTNPKLAGGINTQPTPLPQPMHEYRVMVIELQDMQPAYKVSLNFNFEYQTCATGAGVKNILNISKGQQ